MESQNDFDKLLSFDTQTPQENPISIPLSDIVPNFSLAFGAESQNIQEIKSLANSNQCGFLESLLNGKESLDIKNLNPLSYPRSISVINELMQEKAEKIYATTHDPNDLKLHLLLIYKEQFTNLDTTMQTSKRDLTNKAERLTSLLPNSMEQNPNLFLERAQEVWSSAKAFQESARDGLLWINAFFSTFEDTLSDREKNLIFNHAKTIQTHWKAQAGGEDGKIVLENGMIYQEYQNDETPDIYGFTIITQNFVYAYREETLEDNTTQVVLQIY